MKYVVKVTEKLVKHVIVEADTEYEAEDKAWKAYDDEKIVLDYNDYDGVDFDCAREADKDDITNYVNINDL